MQTDRADVARGLERFPIELGVDYGRSNGDSIAVFPSTTQV